VLSCPANLKPPVRFMKYPLYLLAACLVWLASCTSSHNKQLLGKWKAIQMESPRLNQEIQDAQLFIDTVGKSTTATQNKELYGVENMDSVREIMKEQIDLTLKEQKRMIDSTWLNFLPNGIVASNFGAPKPDTINWYLDEEGALILDEMKMKGAGDKVVMEIVTLKEDTLRLRFNENGYSSTATFIRDEK